MVKLTLNEALNYLGLPFEPSNIILTLTRLEEINEDYYASEENGNKVTGNFANHAKAVENHRIYTEFLGSSEVTRFDTCENRFSCKSLENEVQKNLDTEDFEDKLKIFYNTCECFHLSNEEVGVNCSWNCRLDSCLVSLDSLLALYVKFEGFYPNANADFFKKHRTEIIQLKLDSENLKSSKDNIILTETTFSYGQFKYALSKSQYKLMLKFQKNKNASNEFLTDSDVFGFDSNEEKARGFISVLF
ncbi:MAG: hypothetical protein ABL930_03835, partial [Pseudobdellovibrio sp.]